MLVKTKGYARSAELNRGARIYGYFDVRDASLHLELEVDHGAEGVYKALARNFNSPIDVYIGVPEDPTLPELLEKTRLRAAKAEEELAKLKASIQALTK